MADIIELPPNFIGFYPLPCADIENVQMALKLLHHFILTRFKLALAQYNHFVRSRGWLTIMEGEWDSKDVCSGCCFT
jgi:hypothetical protein